MAASFAISGHHAGLPNGAAANEERIRRQEDTAGPSSEFIPIAIADFKDRLSRIDDPHESKRLQQGMEYMMSLGARKPTLRSQRNDPLACEFLTRILFSALVDADRLDTEKFSQYRKADIRHSYRKRVPALSELCTMLDNFISTKAVKKQSSAIRELRRSVRLACQRYSQFPRGMFTLTVPTGGGKTLASMDFALRHAQKHNLQRVIVVEPYLSIIDQAAEEFRNAFGHMAVLEHHSLSTTSPTSSQDDNPTALDLAAENWSAPIIVTTTVQFFESLFTDCPAPSRKLHNIAESVVIFDEAQSFPRHLLLPILAMLKQFYEFAGTSFLFMSATLPDFATTIEDAVRLGEYADVSPESGPIRNTLQSYPTVHRITEDAHPFTIAPRVEYDWDETLPGLSTWSEVAKAVGSHPQSLTVLNLKRHAHKLCCEMLRQRPRVLYLSTNLCPAHRRVVLQEAFKMLETEEEFSLVATQCIEAGVDIDFPVLFRAVGPLDSIAQAAGRCNRNDGPTKGRVILLTPEDDGREGSKKLPPSAIYQQGTHETRATFWKQNLDNPEVFLNYYQRLFRLASLDQPIAREFQHMKINRDMRPKLAFETTAKAFRVIDSPTISVFVNWSRRDHSVRRLKRIMEALQFDASRLWRVMRMARRFQVNIYQNEFNQHRALFEEVIPGAFFTAAYHTQYGLNLDGSWPQDFVC